MFGKGMDMNGPHPFIEGYLFFRMVEDGLPFEIQFSVGDSAKEGLEGGVIFDSSGEIWPVTEHMAPS